MSVIGAVAFVFLAASAAELPGIFGTVKDRTGAVVRDARVSLLDARQAVLATARTDGEGRFAFGDVAAGTYLLVTHAPGFARSRSAVSVENAATRADVVLDPSPLSEEVTVTANPGRVESVDAVSQPVSVIGAEELARRGKSVLGEVANEEVGIHLQRTSPTIAGIFVRGLTGNKVSVFLDGHG